MLRLQLRFPNVPEANLLALLRVFDEAQTGEGLQEQEELASQECIWSTGLECCDGRRHQATVRYEPGDSVDENLVHFGQRLRPRIDLEGVPESGSPACV